MITSIEPGYYEPNEFGIRIENLYVIRACPATINTNNTNTNNTTTYCYFEPLTLVPIKRNLILMELLTKDEITWLNNYHQLVMCDGVIVC